MIKFKCVNKTNNKNENNSGRKGSVNPKLQSYVDRAISSALQSDALVEVKTRFISTAAATQLIYSTSAVVPVVLDFAPTMQQGDGDGFRNGNRIRVKKASLRVHLSQAYVSDPGQRPNIVRCMIGYIKNDPNNDPSTAAQFNTMFYSSTAGSFTTQDNTAGATGIQTYMAPVNENGWKIFFDKTVGICNEANNSTQQFSVMPSSNPYHKGNDTVEFFNYNSTVVMDIDVTSVLPKIIEYQETTQYPVNTHGPYIWFFPRVDGSLSGTGNTNAPIVNAAMVLKYTDV